MLKTSLDLLYIVLAFCILWLTIFASWGIYYLVMLLRQAKEMVDSVKGIVEKVSGLVAFLDKEATKVAKTVDFFYDKLFWVFKGHDWFSKMFGSKESSEEDKK